MDEKNNYFGLASHKGNIREEGFSVHTLLLKKQLTYELYREIKENAYKISSELEVEIYKDGNALNITAFRSAGIRIKIFQNRTNEKNLPPHVEIIVNPCKLLGISSPMSIFPYSSKNTSCFISNFNHLMRYLHSELFFENFTLSRIDFCVNFRTESEYETDLILKLIHKIYIPKGFKQIEFDSTHKNYKKKNKKSYRITSADETFTVYDKRFQIIEENIAKEENLTNQVLRLELAMNRRKILKIAFECGLTEEEISNEKIFKLLCSNSFHIMGYYIFKFFPVGTYYTYECAINIIKREALPKKITNRMLFLIEKLSDCKNVNRALEIAANKFNLSQKQISHLMNKFDEIMLNPVTLNNRGLYKIFPSMRSYMGFC